MYSFNLVTFPKSLFFSNLFLLYFLFFSCHCLFINAFYNSSDNPVEILTNQDIQKKVFSTDEPWIIEFFQTWCGHCKNFAPEYQKAAKAMKGIVHFGAVEDQSAMGPFNISGYPTVKSIIGHNKNINNAVDYRGQRTAEALIDFAFEQLKLFVKSRIDGKNKKSNASKVVELKDSDFEKNVLKDNKSWFILFYNNKNSNLVTEDWVTVASNVIGNIKFGKYDITSKTNEVAKKLNITSQEIRYFYPNEKSYDSAYKYDGLLLRDDIERYIKAYSSHGFKVTQVTVKEDLDSGCSNSVCIVTFLPDIPNITQEEKKENMDLINSVARSRIGSSLRFLWIKGGDQLDMEEQMHLEFGYPAVIAINSKKKKFAIHRGKFNMESLIQFGDSIIFGKVSVMDLPKDLKIVDIKDAKKPSEKNEEL